MDKWMFQCNLLDDRSSFVRRTIIDDKPGKGQNRLPENSLKHISDVGFFVFGRGKQNVSGIHGLKNIKPCEKRCVNCRRVYPSFRTVLKLTIVSTLGSVWLCIDISVSQIFSGTPPLYRRPRAEIGGDTRLHKSLQRTTWDDAFSNTASPPYAFQYRSGRGNLKSWPRRNGSLLPKGQRRLASL